MTDPPALGRIDPGIPAEAFFERHISTRRPVVISGLPDDPTFCARAWVDLDYLAAQAGDVDVRVEPMHPAMRQFGTDVERVTMPFREFLAGLRTEEAPNHYLTTQYTDEDDGEDEAPETVLPPPTNALQSDFPRVPRIMGNLYLQQVNLWVGRSSDGSSSGLHHDYHDNLYCLLRGRKRFVLFPPQEAENLHPHGKLETVHPNGVIAYAGTTVRADGLMHRNACVARVQALERKLEALPKGKSGASRKERKALMAAHDAALDELASAELEEDTGNGQDDFDALLGDLEDARGSAGPSAAEDEEDDKRSVASEPAGDADDSADPPSFSHIPTAQLHQHLGLPTSAVLPSYHTPDGFPGLARAAAPYVVELNAGEMLYLPASWWHEVTSSSDADNVHMAFNYWFYPPDALNNFEEPYADTLIWQHIRSRASKVTQGLSDAESKRKQSEAQESGPSKKQRR